MLTITIAGDDVATLGKQAVALAALLNAGAKPAAAAAAPANKPAAAPTPPPANGGTTINALRDQGRACIKAGKNAEMKAALKELGADSITTLDPSKYAELEAKLKAILTPAAGEDAL